MKDYTFPVLVRLNVDLSNASHAQDMAIVIEQAVQDALENLGHEVEVCALQPRPGTMRSMTCDQE